MRVLVANDCGTATGGAEPGCLRLPAVDALDRATAFRASPGLGTPERMSGAPPYEREARSAGVG